MVAVHFKLSSLGTIELDLTEPLSWKSLFGLCTVVEDVERAGIIAVRNGKVLRLNDVVADSDVIDVFPAISGG